MASANTVGAEVGDKPTPEREQKGDTGKTGNPLEDWVWDINDPLALGNASNPVTIFLATFGVTPEDVPKIVTRAGIIVIGVVLFLIGITMIMSGSRTAAIIGDTVKDTAVDLIPAGKAAKLVRKVL